MRVIFRFRWTAALYMQMIVFLLLLKMGLLCHSVDWESTTEAETLSIKIACVRWPLYQLIGIVSDLVHYNICVTLYPVSNEMKYRNLCSALGADGHKLLYTARQNKTTTQSFCDNFGKYERILIIFSPLHSTMNCERSCYIIRHLTLNLLPQ